MTYLQIINAVMRRLRETEVTDVNSTDYSKLIGEYVNSVKKEVEAAWNWNALRTTLTLNTTTGIFNYTLLGSGSRFRVSDVVNDTSNYMLQQKSALWMNQRFLTVDTQLSTPSFYSFNGVDTNLDSKVDLYPIPDGVYVLRFNVTIPQDDLIENSDTLQIPSEPIIQGALARAISERGEDGGRLSNDQYLLYRSAMSDEIAIEAGRFSDETVWYSV
tara:strand:- start:621 stop:1268 length:648 start_codon:yes stop_codon:yes gene_type:complete